MIDQKNKNKLLTAKGKRILQVHNGLTKPDQVSKVAIYVGKQGHATTANSS